MKNFISILIILSLCFCVTLAFADYKDLDQCTINNHNSICTEQVTIKVIEKKETKTEISLNDFLNKLVAMVMNYNSDNGVKTTSYFSDADADDANMLRDDTLISNIPSTKTSTIIKNDEFQALPPGATSIWKDSKGNVWYGSGDLNFNEY